MSGYPPKLQAIITLFEGLGEEERRGNLIAYADRVRKYAPERGGTYAIEDVRKDEECTDTVGIFLQLDPAGGTRVRVTLGPQVQTLTRALAAILCHGLEGSRPEEIVGLSAEFIPAIVGGPLVKLRSQTVYYIFRRIQGSCRLLLAPRA